MLADRLVFQLAAALAVAAALLLVWRRTRSPAAVAWLGLNPVFGAIIVNSGQIDALIGLAILAAALLTAERRGWAAGVALGVATLIKVTSLLALPALVFWAWRRGDRRLARQVAAATAATTAVVYLPFVAGQSHVLAGADHSVTPGAAWNLPAELLVGKDAGRDLPGLLPSNDTLSVLFYLSLALVGVLAVVLAWRWASAARPDLGVGAATASYAAAAEYTLPWYAGWALPALADRRPSRLAWVIWWQSVVLLAAWKLPHAPHRLGGGHHPAGHVRVRPAARAARGVRGRRRPPPPHRDPRRGGGAGPGVAAPRGCGLPGVARRVPARGVCAGSCRPGDASHPTARRGSGTMRRASGDRFGRTVSRAASGRRKEPRGRP